MFELTLLGFSPLPELASFAIGEPDFGIGSKVLLSTRLILIMGSLLGVIESTADLVIVPWTLCTGLGQGWADEVGITLCPRNSLDLNYLYMRVF